MQCYVVGGAVRDLLMGQKPKDADMAFSGSEEDFMLAFPTAQKVGKSVQVWILHGCEYSPLHQNCLAQDLAQRDLTINALALDEQGRVFAHPLAFFDMKHGLLRPASPSAFFKDPVRIYRLARFAALYPHFSVHEDALQQAFAVAQTQAHASLPGERVGRECVKALQSPCPSRFFDVLEQTQSLMPWFAEYAVLSMQERRRWGKLMDAVGDFAKETPHEMLSLLRWMLLGFLMGNKEEKAYFQHAIYLLSERLHLPLFYAKAAYCMAQEASRGASFLELSVQEKVMLLLKVHKLGLSVPFWLIIDYVYEQHIRDIAWQSLDVVRDVHLPQRWQNQGAFSGQKHVALQCEALQAFLEKRLQPPLL